MAFPILTFHAIDDRPSVISFPASLFKRGIDKLHAHGYRTLTLLQMADSIRQGKQLPEQSLAITFDDGYQSVYTEAFPVLRQYGMTATVFLTVGEERPADLDTRLPSLEGRSMLSWREICEMRDAGMNFGGHTLTHPDLTRVPAARAEIEIGQSKATIEEMLDSPVRTFAYPYGHFDASSLDLARRYFDCACSARLGFVTPRSPLFALERLDAYYVRSEFLFDLMLTRSFETYIGMRGLLRGVRHRLPLSAPH